MQYVIVALLITLQLTNLCVSGSRSNGMNVRGSDHQNRELLFFRERKQVPTNYAYKAGLKKARVRTAFSMPTAVPSPPFPPPTSSTAKNPSQGEASTYSLGKDPASPTPPTPASVFPPQTPAPSESPSSQPSHSPTRRPSLFPTPSPTPSPTPLPTPLPTPQPTKVPTPQPTQKPVKVPTNTLTYVGNDGNPGDEFPLAMCEGDCDGDSDCMGNLICMQRDGTESVPGCNGSGNSPGTDFCTDPSLSTQSNYVGFMLRLYWQSSYFWQETHSETWWCLECTKCDEFSLGDGPNHGCDVPGNNGGSCREGHTIWIRKCKDTRRHFKWEILKNSGSGDQIRARGSNLCLSTVSNKYVEMRDCDSGSSRQLFMPITNINKFELRPYHQRAWSRSNSRCLSQLHHPKDKELVGLHNCQTARNHETIYWEDYHR